MASYTQCLARADQADEKIARLHRTVEEICNFMAESSVPAVSGGGGALGGAEREELEQLRALQSTKGKDQPAGGNLKQERDEAIKAKEALEVEVDKLNYRITHLLRAIDPSNPAAVSKPKPDLSLRKGSCLAGTSFQ
mmetsp:Transcript_1508/g.3102  ORF Transcript_1508/g.3102 Transcript_1508/m.3102 type:complete len:137 (-) Transcript_1508:360-770(-)